MTTLWQQLQQGWQREPILWTPSADSSHLFIFPSGWGTRKQRKRILTRIQPICVCPAHSSIHIAISRSSHLSILHPPSRVGGVLVSFAVGLTSVSTLKSTFCQDGLKPRWGSLIGRFTKISSPPANTGIWAQFWLYHVYKVSHHRVFLQLLQLQQTRNGPRTSTLRRAVGEGSGGFHLSPDHQQAPSDHFSSQHLNLDRCPPNRQSRILAG